MNDTNEEEKETLPNESFVFVQFAGIGSAEFSLQIGKVSPTQLLGLAGYLELKAKGKIVELETLQAQQAEQMRLSKPNQGLIIPKGKISG